MLRGGQYPTLSEPDNMDGLQPGHYAEYEFGVNRLETINNF